MCVGGGYIGTDTDIDIKKQNFTHLQEEVPLASQEIGTPGAQKILAQNNLWFLSISCSVVFVCFALFFLRQSLFKYPHLN